jgi:hypothetical protein
MVAGAAPAGDRARGVCGTALDIPPSKQPLLICDECVTRYTTIIAEVVAKGDDLAFSTLHAADDTAADR